MKRTFFGWKGELAPLTFIRNGSRRLNLWRCKKQHSECESRHFFEPNPGFLIGHDQTTWAGTNFYWPWKLSCFSTERLFVGVRGLNTAEMFELKNPTILLSKYYKTGIAIGYCHLAKWQTAKVYLLNNIRQNVWLENGKVMMQWIVSSCLPSQWKTRLGKKLMSPRPASKMADGRWRLTKTGVKYLYPILMKRRRALEEVQMFDYVPEDRGRPDR